MEGLGILLIKGEIGQIISLDEGIIEQWRVDEGEQVDKGDIVLTMRPLSNPLELKSLSARTSGFIAEIIAYPGTHVIKGESLALITAQGDKNKDLEVVGFVSSLSGKLLKPGMNALVYPSISDKKSGSALKAVIKKVGRLPTSKKALRSLVKIPELAKYMRTRIEAEPFLVILSLLEDQSNHTGYWWQGAVPSYELDYGIIADFSIIYDEPSIMARLWPSMMKRW